VDHQHEEYGLVGYGASPNPSSINVIEYVEIMTLGDALDFGDLTVARSYAAGFSSGPRGFAADQLVVTMML